MNPADWIVPFVVLIISLTVHEAAHAWVALLGGDRTALRAGQVTLNPLPHIQREPFGMLVLPLLTLWSTNGNSSFGFAHAPYDPYWAARNPRRAAVMSLAGPLANVVLAAIAFVVLWYIARPESGTEAGVRQIATRFLFLNLLLAVFNLVPLPPLDGAGVVRGLFPATGRFFDAIERIPYSTLVVFVLMSYWLVPLYYPIYNAVDSLLPHSTRYH